MVNICGTLYEPKKTAQSIFKVHCQEILTFQRNIEET